MFVYEGVNMLKNHLAISNADSLGEFPLNQYCTRLIEILAAPMIMDIQGDIKCKFEIKIKNSDAFSNVPLLFWWSINQNLIKTIVSYSCHNIMSLHFNGYLSSEYPEYD